MTRKQIWQYSCDFCKKKTYSASAMSTHEKHCTMNSNRICRMCGLKKNNQQPIIELIAILPPRSTLLASEVEKTEGLKWGYEQEYTRDAEEIINAALPALREATDNCPACIMAAIRQAEINIPIASDFNFTEELKTFWDDVNKSKIIREYM